MDTEEINIKIGKRIRELRNRNGLTLQELADRTELTKGFISQLERGQVLPSVVSLFDLIECLGTTPADFFKDSDEEQTVFREKDYFIKEDENGNRTEWLVPSAQSNQMEPILVEIRPGSVLEPDDAHNGEEFGYLLSGKLVLTLGERRYEIHAGESFYFEASKVHNLENTGRKAAKLIWVSTPPSF